MKSLALQGNSFVREKNRFAFTKTHLDYMKQRVHSVISIFLGEWFLDQTLGIPYLPKDDSRTKHRALIESALITKITAIEGIKRLTSFTSTYQPHERKLCVDFIAETDKGEKIEMKDAWSMPSPGGNG